MVIAQSLQDCGAVLYLAVNPNQVNQNTPRLMVVLEPPNKGRANIDSRGRGMDMKLVTFDTVAP